MNKVIKGRVIHGHGRGKVLGIPTINLDIEGKIDIENGVYISCIMIDGKKYFGVTNVGTKPTFDEENVTIETHILDFDKNVYGMEIELLLCEKIREIKKFNDIKDLKKQIDSDIIICRERSNKYV